MKIKILALSLFVVLTITGFSEVNHQWRCERGLTKLLPGVSADLDKWSHDYTESCWSSNVKTSVSGFDDGFYQQLFPGMIGRSADIVVVPVGVKDGCIGVTMLDPNSRGNYRALGNHSDGIKNVSVEVYNSGDYMTMVHELAHVHNAGMRGNMGGYHFFDEGMAVFTEEMLNPEKIENDALSLKYHLTRGYSPMKLKQHFLDRFNEVPPAEDYCLAGFFMTQVYDLCGPLTLKYLICADQRTESADHIYRQVLQDAWTKSHLDEEGFWKVMFERMGEWVK